MLMFNCDYNEGAHPKVLEALIKTNMEQTPGYCEDKYCELARTYIRKALKNENCDVHFMAAGTLTNLTVISAALKTHQGVLSPHTGHISVHEAGAIEATGHKVLPLDGGGDSKISAEQVKNYVDAHRADASFEHMVQPKMVYISQPTENGALYTLNELQALRRVCDEYGLYLYADGARMGYGLSSPDTDVTLPDLAELCDVFYIGGTKVGCLFGEAVVISNNSLKEDFRYVMKQKGGLAAKGRLLGLQFAALFEDSTYTDIARSAVKQAYDIADACKKAGFKMFCDSPTNQQFPIFPDNILKKLSEKYVFSYWERFSETESVVRICTSWATRDEDVQGLIKDIMALKA